MATQLRSEQIKDIVPLSNWDGWNTADAMTYVSATSFSVTGDQTAKYSKGTKIKLTNGGTVKYLYVVSSSYSAGTGLTTVTTTGGSDYSLASGAITSPFYSYVENPQLFPAHFNYTPSLSNLTLGNGTSEGKFKIAGGIIKGKTLITFGSTTAITNAFPTYSIPISADGHAMHDFLDFGTKRFLGQTTFNGNVVSLAIYGAAETFSNEIGVTSTNPHTWGTGDAIRSSFIGVI